MSWQFTPMFKQHYSDVRKQRKAIMKALAGNSSSINEMENELSIPKSVILWNLLAMLKWGQVEIVEERDDELIFAITNVSHNT